MKIKKKYTGVELMRSAPVSSAVIRLALPMMVAMLAQAVYNTTDMFFIGQTGDPNKVAAISLTFPLFMLSQALGNTFAVGGSSFISRMLGAKKLTEARRAAAVSLFTVFGAGVVMTAVLWTFKTPILKLIGSSDATFPHTYNYFSIVVLFMAFAATSVAMSAKMRSEGAAQKAMTLQLIGVSLNIILDPILILWFDLGTAGAAWATAAGQMAAFAYGIHYFLSKKTILSISPKEYKPNRGMMLQILSIGIPAGLSNVIMSAAHILSNRILSGYGDYIVAGSGVKMRISSLFIMMIHALGQGFQPFAGYNYGAGQLKRLRKGFKLTMMYATGLCIFGSIVLYLFAPYLIQIFIDDVQSADAGAAIMRAFVWGLPFIGSQILLTATFQALGKPMQSMIITIGRQFLFFIPLLYILTHFFGFKGFVWTQPIADILTTGIAVALGIPLFKIMREEKSTELPITQTTIIKDAKIS